MGNTKRKRKKLKKDNNNESWKEDKKGYNVPFVGTVVSETNINTNNNNNIGIIRYNTWPTGLLLAYMNISPNMNEFLNNDNNKLNVLFMEVLVEIITIGIPIIQLKCDIICYQIQIKQKQEENEQLLLQQIIHNHLLLS